MEQVRHKDARQTIDLVAKKYLMIQKLQQSL